MPPSFHLPWAWRKAARTLRWLPGYAWQRATRTTPREDVHLIIALADHFEPSVVPGKGNARSSYDEQERRLENWCRRYPRAVESWRDHEGRPFVHTYFYPAEQYDKGLLQRLSNHCRAGWGEVEIHLHHGTDRPDTADNLRSHLLAFRDALAFEHDCLCYLDGAGSPRYAFVHGNFALANSAGGLNCGVDSEMQVLSETGCYADMTLPPGPFFRTHIRKINSLYECSLPLSSPNAHHRGRDLECGRRPTVFPLMVEGPLMLSFRDAGGDRRLGVENGALTTANPPSMYRLRLWKQAGVSVEGRPNWVFIRLQCHGMDPRDQDGLLGTSMQQFLRELVAVTKQETETLHFVSCREMVNILLAACDGREGNPGDYRDHRLKRIPAASVKAPAFQTERLACRG